MVFCVAGFAFILIGLNAFELYDDLVSDGDTPIVAFGEIAFGFGLAIVLLVAAYWIATSLPETFLGQVGKMAGATAVTVGTGSGIVILSQAIQSEFKWQLLFTDIVALGILAGLGVGYYDSLRHQQAKTIKRERNEFKALFTNVPTAVLAVTKKGDRLEVNMANPAFEKIFGYTKAELDGMDVRDVLRPAGEEPEPVTDSSLTGLAEEHDEGWQEVRVTLQTEYGQREFVRISAPVDDQQREDSPEEYAFYIDVTEQLQREERIQVMSRALRHDLRNRLTIIQGGAQTLAEDKQELDETMVEQIQQAAAELESLSEQTREIERLVDNDYERGPMELRPIIEDVVDVIRKDYPECRIAVEVPDALAVRADPTLKTAMENIIENAVEHNDSEKPSVEIAAVESLDSRYVDIQITDNGPGLPKEVSTVVSGERDADPLHHSPSGMGLWVATWIINQHGGELEPSANVPRGTTITVRLPRAKQ